MGPALPPIITTGAKLLGPILKPLGGFLGGLVGVGLGNRANRAMARESMAFQREMANTQAQRAVADYTAAGLNPALAYDRTAAAPAGATTQLGNGLQAGISNALQVRQLMNDIELQQNQKARIIAETDLMAKDGAKREAETEQVRAATRQIEKAIEMMNEELQGAKAEGDLWRSLDAGGPAAKAAGRFLPLLSVLLGRRKGGGITINR